MSDKKIGVIAQSSQIRISTVFLAIVVLYITLTLAANATFAKIVHFGDFEGVGGEVIMPLILLLADIIAEVYGYKVSRALLWLAMLSEFVFSGAILFIIHLPSPAFWNHQDAFNQVFNKLLQVGPAAIVAVLIGQFLNIYLISKFKIFLKGRYFWFRSIASIAIGSAVSGGIYFFIGFRGLYAEHHLWVMFLSAYLMRLSYAVVGGGPATIIVHILKKVEKIDVYDGSTDFNPFKLSLSEKK